MFTPARTKYRKWRRFRGAQYGVATRGQRIAFGDYGLKVSQGGEISGRQLEAARKAITHALKRGGKTWVRIFPQFPITRKAAEVPMGSGKGNVEFYVAPVKAGNVIFELAGVDEETAKAAFRLASSKLPLKTKFVKK